MFYYFLYFKRQTNLIFFFFQFKRAPVLVALALIELGMKYEDAIEEIRQKRRGAINKKQLEYLATYKPRYKLKGKTPQRCILQ